MRKIDELKFIGDYEKLIADKELVLKTLNNEISVEMEKVERVCSQNNYSAKIKEILAKEVVAEINEKYDLTKTNELIEFFEKYFIVEEELTESEIL